jgi:hypothetical protein
MCKGLESGGEEFRRIALNIGARCQYRKTMARSHLHRLCWIRSVPSDQSQAIFVETSTHVFAPKLKKNWM